MDERIDDLAGVLLLLDFLIKVVEEIWLIGHGLIQIILKSLH